jgi:hypothetical protein
MNVSIHQSQYLPWAPYFKKIASSDVFVVMDDVQYQKNGVQNRNKIAGRDTDFWLTLPVSSEFGEKISEKNIVGDKWKKKHLSSLKQCYSKCPGWPEHQEFFEQLYSSSITSLNEINLSFIRYFLRYYEIEVSLVLMSGLECKGEKSDLVLDICRQTGATNYISGFGSKDYLVESDFNRSGIDILYLEAIPPTYERFKGDKLAGLSVVDFMFNADKTAVVDYLLG